MKNESFDAIFIPGNSYHIEAMEEIASLLSKSKLNVSFIEINNLVDEDMDFKTLNNKFPVFGENSLLRGELKTKLIFAMSTQPGAIVEIFKLLNKSNIVSSCLIETPMYDLKTLKKRYKNLDILFTTNNKEKELLGKVCKKSFVVGVPRFEKIIKTYREFPEKDCAVVNLNFGWHDSHKGPEWFNDVLEVSKGLNLKLILNKHYGDKNEYYQEISKNSIEDDILESSLLITRESSVIFQALILQRPVVFYNRYKYTGDQLINNFGSFSVPQNKVDLRDAIISELESKHKVLSKSKEYLDQVFLYDESKGSCEKISKILIEEIAFKSEYLILQTKLNFYISNITKFIYKLLRRLKPSQN